MSTLTDENPIDEKTAAGHGAYLNDSESAAATAAKNQQDAFEQEFGGENYKKDGVPGDLSGGARQAENNPINFTGGGLGKLPVKSTKKKGPIAALIGLLLGGGGGLIILASPGLGIVTIKESLAGDLNDQLAAMDLRSDHVFRAKLSDMSSGVCGQTITIRCKFKSMSKRQIAKFEKAGFTDIETKDSFGRKKITSMTAPDGTKITNPADIVKAGRTNPQIGSAMRRVYNPKFYGLSDKTADKVFSKFKTDKSKKISGKNNEERKKNLKAATAGEQAGSVGDRVMTEGEGDNARQYVEDADGNKYYADTDPDKFNDISQKEGSVHTKADAAKSTGVKATKSVLSSGLKGVSIIGAADSGCTVYNTARAVAAAAKIARAIQLAQFAMIILSTADSIKAGDATPEEVEFIGNMLTSVDNRETIASDSNPNEMIANPFYKKSAFDSPGYKTAAFNDAPTLTAQSQQYMIGGGLAGTLSSVMDIIDSVIPGDKAGMRTACKTIQSWWARGAGLVVGIASAVGSFGVSTALSIGASIAIGFALPFLEAALADIVAGTVIAEDIQGVEAGDAVFAGSSALLGGMAQARGLQPLNKDGLQTYLAVSQEVKSDIAAVEQYEAKDEPFNVMNQYSFAGSFVRSVYPAANQVKAGVAGIIPGMQSLFSTATTSLISPKLHATQIYNAERFSKCEDEGYAELGIDADIFCNVRYGLTNRELAMDTTAVVDYMVGAGYIDDETGEAQGDYKEFVEKCVDRADGWGETSEEGGSVGLECVDASTPWSDISYFRVYTVDSSIVEGMEEEPKSQSQGSVSANINGDTVQYYQVEEPWKSQMYGFDTIGSCGCGPSTLASVVSTYYKDNQVTPKEMADYFVSLGGQMPTCGSYWVWESQADAFKSKYGISIEPVTPNAANATRGLQDGGLIVISVGSATPFTTGGHIMMIRGQAGSNFLVGDSASRTRSESQEGFAPSEFHFGQESGTKGMWIVKKAA